MTDEIYQSMIQQRGREYRSDQIKPYSHYREPIDTTPGRLAGNSRVWGDASPEVQSRVIDELIDASQRAGLSPRETAHVLAIARIESGFNPDAAAGTTSASGLGQFVDRTGAGLRNHPVNDTNRFDARSGADALVEHFIENRDLARRRGQGEEYIYKYHHDGPTRDYGGLGLSQREVMPRLDEYERFVDERLARRQGQTTPDVTPGETRTAPDPQPRGPGSFDEVMRVMLPPQNGVNPHITSDFGPRSIANGSSNHRGVDFNYVGGQQGVNLRHPTVHSPVSGVVVYGDGQGSYGTVKIRDDQGNLHEILHLDSRSVRVTDPPTRVNAGDPIGTMGGRGPDGARDYAQHVHYQVRNPAGQLVDPEAFWNSRTVQQGSGQQTGTPDARSPGTGQATLRLDSRGADVVALQESLNRLGYTGRDGQPLETRSGIYGPETKFAVEALQRARGIEVDGVVGRDTRGALAIASERPLLSESTHPNHALYWAIARQLPAGMRPEVAANITLQAMENGITSVDKLQRVEVAGSDVFVTSTTPGYRVNVDLQAPTPSMQDMSDHVRQQSQQSRQTPPQDQQIQAEQQERAARTVMA